MQEGAGRRLEKGGSVRIERSKGRGEERAGKADTKRGGTGWNERLVSTLAHFVNPPTRCKPGSAILTFPPHT